MCRDGPMGIRDANQIREEGLRPAVQGQSVRGSPLIGSGVLNVLDMSRDVTGLPARVRSDSAIRLQHLLAAPSLASATCSGDHRASSSGRALTITAASRLSVGRSDASPGRVLRLTRRGRNRPIVSFVCLMVLSPRK
jgi:hypothetical protein